MKIGLLGFGTVGSGVYEILTSDRLKRQGIEVSAALVRDIEKYKSRCGDRVRFTADAYEILEDDEIEVIVEVLGGIEKPFEYISHALKRKKSVVTANKAVLAAHMEELLKLAEENGVSLLYEASVGGGIPLIRTLCQSARALTYDEVGGILNGTSNYILTKMSKEDLSFETALRQAQEAGFAEADPTDDIDGPDVARKISVLATTVLGRHLPLEKIFMSGIRHIADTDMSYADRWDCVVKMIGRAKQRTEGFYAGVFPAFVPKTSLIAGVNGAFNIGTAKGDFLQEVAFYGEGAGKLATAAAVVSDILDIRSAERRLLYAEKINFAESEVRLFPQIYYLRFHEKKSAEAEKVFSLCNLGYKKIDEEKSVFLIDGRNTDALESFLTKMKEEKTDYFIAQTSIDLDRQ